MAAFVLLSWPGPAARAQPACSINIGPDLTICQGESIELQGPSGFSNFLWSTGETTPSISVGTAGDYWCQVSYPSGNLVTNGDFSAGNTGFGSQFTYSLISVQNEGYYTVGLNASWYHTQFQGTGNGNFLIANAGYGSWVNGQLDIWCQTIPCCPGQTYTLSYRARTLTNALPARAVWMMDGVLAQWPDITFPTYNAGWQQFSTTWTAGPGQTSVSACLRLTSGDGVGDDFGLDDISIAGTIILKDTVHVSVTPLPVVDLGPDPTLCAGDEMELDATVPTGSYVWQDGSTGPTFQVDAPGNYNVTVTAQNCSNADQVNVAYTPLPLVQLGADTLLCAGSTLNLSASGPGYVYLWQDGSSAATFQVNGPGLYWAEATLNNCAARDSIQVGYKPMPVVSLGNDTAACAGSPILLDATFPGATYLWQDGSTASTLSVSTGGNYQVAVDLNGCTAQDAVQVTIHPLPVVDLGPDTMVCPGSPVTFDAGATGASYLWNDGSTGPTLTTTAPGNHAVQVTVNGCSVSDAAVLSNFNLQTVDLGPDRTLCAGASATLGISIPGATYSWSTGATTDSISTATAGTYWADATLNGCTVRDSINVSVTPPPLVSLGPDVQLCPGQQTVLDASTAGGSYLWNNGASTPAITVGAGTWSVDVTVNGCTSSDAVMVSELAAPSVDLGPDTMLCPGNTLVLNAGIPGMSYLWNTGATGPSITIGSNTSASLIVTDANGCTATDTVQVTYANPGTLSLGPDTAFCAGGQVILDASMPGATGYLWSDGSTNAELGTSASGTYWVHVAQGACTVSDTIALQSVQAPSISLGNDTTLCPGGTLDLFVPSTGLLLAWQDGSGSSNFHVHAPGDYWAAATNSAGCTDTAYIHVDYLDPGAVDLGPDTAICAGTSIVLNAGLPGGTTQWTGAVGASTPSLTADAAGTYIATTVVAGCSSTDSITIAVVAPPSVDLGPDLSLCTGSTVQLSASGPSLLWDDGSSAAVRTIHQGGSYWVRSSDNGCSASDTLTVTENPVPVIDLGNDTALCAGALLGLDATFPGGTYAWNDGTTSAYRQVGPGAWSVQVTALGCTGSDSIQIDPLPAPLVDLPADTTLCNGATWSVDVGQPGSSYLWSTGETASTLVIAAPGTYGVTVNRAGCLASGQVLVNQVDLSAFTLGADTMICPGATLGLGIEVPGATVVWQDGSTMLHRPVDSAGNYQATITVDGCTAQASIAVGLTPVPAVDLGADQVLCAGDTTLLIIDPGAAQLYWNTGSIDTELEITSTGTYSASLTLDGCIRTDTVTILFRPVIGQLDLGPDRELCTGTSILLDATIPGATYLWNNGARTPTLTTNRTGTYWVVADGPCIHASDSITITEAECTPVVSIPNAFTPDGDGINDLFIPVVHGPLREWSLMVFDRWGGQIFTSDRPDSGWDGRLHGTEVPVGVYIWDLHYSATTGGGVVQERRRGTVTLVR